MNILKIIKNGFLVLLVTSATCLHVGAMEKPTGQTKKKRTIRRAVRRRNRRPQGPRVVSSSPLSTSSTSSPSAPRRKKGVKRRAGESTPKTPLNLDAKQKEHLSLIFVQTNDAIIKALNGEIAEKTSLDDKLMVIMKQYPVHYRQVFVLDKCKDAPEFAQAFTSCGCSLNLIALKITLEGFLGLDASLGNLYTFFGIDQNTTKTAIKEKRDQMALSGKYRHTDKGGSVEMFQKLNMAYKILYNDNARVWYNFYLIVCSKLPSHSTLGSVLSLLGGGLTGLTANVTWNGLFLKGIVSTTLGNPALLVTVLVLGSTVYGIYRYAHRTSSVSLQEEGALKVVRLDSCSQDDDTQSVTETVHADKKPRIGDSTEVEIEKLSSDQQEEDDDDERSIRALLAEEPS